MFLKQKIKIWWISRGPGCTQLGRTQPKAVSIEVKTAWSPTSQILEISAVVNIPLDTHLGKFIE